MDGELSNSCCAVEASSMSGNTILSKKKMLKVLSSQIDTNRKQEETILYLEKKENEVI